MSGGLESLSNPLERLSVLPTSVSLRVNPLTNSPEWSAVVQYFKNDIVVSGVNGGAYIFVGGALDQSCVRGGVDPALDTAGLWQKFTQTGVETYVPAATTFALAGILGAQTIAVTNGTLQDVDAGSVWLAILNYQITWTGNQTDADLMTWTVASTGTTGGTVNVDVLPRVTKAVNRGTATFVVAAGTNPPAQIDLALQGNIDGAASQLITAIAGSLAWVRLQ